MLSLLLVVAGSATAKTTSKHSSGFHSSAIHKTSGRRSSRHSVKKASHHSRGQRAIDQERTRAIQAALIREHYLNGEPSGAWDQSTREALMRYQADNHWQTKVTPDSRALIKLGLGPDHKGLLNPDTAAISAPHEIGVEPVQPGGAAQ